MFFCLYLLLKGYFQSDSKMFHGGTPTRASCRPPLRVFVHRIPGVGPRVKAPPVQGRRAAASEQKAKNVQTCIRNHIEII